MRCVFVAVLVAASCDRHAATATGTATTTGSARPPAIARGVPCGGLACTQYDSPRDAFLDAIAGAQAVLGIGEVHAPKGATVPSAARRFNEELLPLLSGRASDLLVELMMPPKGCNYAAAEVREQQSAARSRQADSDQGEYLAMGEHARGLGIVPDMLRPTCADLDSIRDAGEEGISASLETIARLTESQAERLVERDARSDADTGKLVVIYGGALHNDLAPPPHGARWSYAPAIDAYVGGRFVAVDLIVPEFIGQDETWRSLPWWPHYDPSRLGARTTLFRTGDRSFVLVFPKTTR